MSIFNSGAGVGAVAAASVVAVGAAAWFQFGAQDVPAPAPQATVVAQPQATEPAPKPAAPDPVVAVVETPKVKAAEEVQQAAPEAESETTPKVPTVAEATVVEAPTAEPELEAAPAAPAPEEAVEQAALVEPTKEVLQEAVEATPEQAIIAPPTFDEVRREQDGMTVIAGTAAPGARVQILLDGTEIATASADGSGKFAAIALIAPDGKGHVLSLLQTGAGQDMASADQIILAPIAAPVKVAQAAPETPTTPAPKPVGEAKTEEPLASPEEAAPVETAAVEPAPTPEPQVQTPQVQAPQVQEPQIQEPEVETPVETAEVPVIAAPETAEAEIETASVAPVQQPQPEQPASTVPEPQPAPQAEPETQEVAVLKTTQDGVELLNAPSPEVMENVALDTISYSDVGDVQLAGRAQLETRSVRVYLNNDAVISLPVDEAGRWRGDLPDVDEGIYTLRVDEVSAAGTVTSRVETPFKREDPVVLAQAAAEKEGPLKQITVQQGATLWAIAQDRYGDGLLYVNVFNANAETIRDPDLIYPGQIFELPE